MGIFKTSKHVGRCALYQANYGFPDVAGWESRIYLY